MAHPIPAFLSVTDLSVDDLVQTDSNPLPHDLAVFPRITALLARHIDSSLSCEEAVSLTFLVVDNPKIAHSLASEFVSRKQNVFSHKGAEIGIAEMLLLSAEKNRVISWEMKVYQALLLVGLRRLLYDLGVDDKALETDGSLAGEQYVKGSRRLLFRLCELLSPKEAKALATALGGGPAPVCLEVLMLSLIARGGGEEGLCQQLHLALQNMGSATLVSRFLALGPGSCSCPVHAAATTQANVVLKEFPDTEYYTQGHGLCVIINQKMFPDGLQDRLGTDRDRDELAATFSLFQAEVLVWNNLPAQDMMDKLRLAQLKASHPAFHWIVVCVLSHGRRVANVDEVLGCDGKGVDRKQIVNMFANAAQCPNLHKKPKFFIFQACRGTEAPQPTPEDTLPMEEISNDSGAVSVVRGWPGMSDYVIASSTIEEFVAFRSTVDGSFYIRHVCKELQDRGHKDHLADVLTIVNKKVMGYRTDYPSTPEFTTTLSKKFQLQRTKESTEKCVSMMARNRLFNMLLGEYIESRAGSS